MGLVPDEPFVYPKLRDFGFLKRLGEMKAKIHPDYVEARVHCACGNSWQTRSQPLPTVPMRRSPRRWRRGS